MTKNEWILSVVQSFYDKAREDVLIGYHFRIIEDFDSEQRHTQLTFDF